MLQRSSLLVAPCFLILAAATSGCSSSEGAGGTSSDDTNPENPELQEQLDESRTIWEALKADQGNSYWYTTSFASWVGFGAETTLTIEDGVVTARSHRAWDEEGNETTNWVEEGADLGSHQTEGAALRTIDDLYDICETEVLTKSEEENYLYLFFDNGGVLSHCTYVPNGCADDCNEGVTIDSLAFG